MRTSGGKPWFAAKRYGYGSSLPVSWEGWAVLVLFVGAVALSLALVPAAAGVAAVLIEGAMFAAICAMKTEGGWKWRWGE